MADFAPWDSEFLHDDEAWFIWPDEKRSKSRKALTCVFANKLRESGSNTLANSLSLCDPDCRCGSGACPQCGKAVNRYFRDATHQEFGSATGGVQLVSIIPTPRDLQPNRLRDVKIGDHAQFLKDLLAAAGARACSSTGARTPLPVRAAGEPSFGESRRTCSCTHLL
jgi:hypothetical protein